MADDADIFTLEIENTNGRNIGGVNRITSPVVAKPASNNNFKLVNVFDHKIFANDLNETLKNTLPFVYIEEYSLISNSLINQFRYFGDITNIGAVTEAAAKQLGGETSSPSTINTIISYVESIRGGIAGAVKEYTPDFIANPLISAKNNYVPKFAKESAFNEQLIGPSLKPYNGLYQTIPTKFKYIMPYFDDKMHDINNKFADNFAGFMGVETQPLKYAPNVFKVGADMVKDVGEAFLSFSPSAVNSPSTYVEIPQYFTSGEYESYTVKFDLLNTYNVDDVQKNYDLLFLLAFQNLPYREDIAKIIPPKLYTLLIPGQIFLPYCHMKSIKIDYVGNRRQLTRIKKFSYSNSVKKGPLPKDEQNIIVPDCYRVTIEFLSMVKPASNFMLIPDIKVKQSGSLITAAEAPSQETPTTSNTTSNTPQTNGFSNTTPRNANLPGGLILNPQSTVNQNLNRLLSGEQPTISNNIIQNTNNSVSGQLQQILQSQR
jgi:hypothetical protein